MREGYKVRFFVREVKNKVITPSRKVKAVVYNYEQLRNRDSFVKKTHKLFKGKDGIYLLYTGENKPAIKFELNGRRMTLYKTATSGFKYPLFRRWAGERFKLL